MVDVNVSACLVTRGDVDINPIIDSLPEEWEKIIWDNSRGCWEVCRPVFSGRIGGTVHSVRLIHQGGDLSVYGRYAAIEYASHDLIYVQDDDVIVSDPQAIVQEWLWQAKAPGPQTVVCNMPQVFRHDFYTDHALVGFGTAFHRDAPRRAFERFMEHHEHMIPLGIRQEVFWRCCDVVFTALTPRVLVDVPKTNLPYAEGPDRMYRQPEHVAERARMLKLALQVRDA